jgi:hypothetical protein
VNCRSSITSGLGKRTGAVLNSPVFAIEDFGEAAKHTYDRGDGTERYTISSHLDHIHVVDIVNGIEKTVNEGASFDYIQDYSGDGRPAREFMKFFTIADTTFVCNTSATPVMDTKDDEHLWTMVIHCVKASFGMNYRVKIDNVLVAQYNAAATVTLQQTSSTIQSNKAITLKTTTIINGLRSGTDGGIGLDAWLAAHAGVGNGNVFFELDANEGQLVMWSDEESYSVEVTDDNNNNDIKAIGRVSTDYDDLPEKCVHDYKIKITGVDPDSDNDYYVRFVADVIPVSEETDRILTGHWAECVGFDSFTRINPTTMPHQLIRNGTTGEFDFELIDWIDRTAGDDNSNPQPSFIGKTISGIGLYQNRIVMLNDENCFASVAYDHFNCFSQSVIVASDDDPIDAVSSDNDVTELNHLLVFDASLMIFSDRAQFLHPADALFTSKTFALVSKSRYSMDTTAAPVASANSAFFPYSFGTYTGVREFKTDALTGTVMAESITTHVREYMPGKCLQVESSTDYDILLIRTEGAPEKIFVYEWFDQDNTRKQAAWHEWILPQDITYMKIVRDVLYLWYNEEGGIGTGYMTIDLSTTDSEGIAFPLKLDTTIKVQADTVNGDFTLVDVLDGLYSAIDNTWLDAHLDAIKVIGAENSGIEGAAVDYMIDVDDRTILVPTESMPDAVGLPYFYVGIEYEAYAEITNPYVRDGQGSPLTTARTTYKSMKFNCAQTGELYIIVDKSHSVTYIKEYNAQTISDPEYLLNSHAPLQDVSIKVPIRSAAERCTITIGSTSHLPFNVLDVDWICKYQERGRRTQ